MAVGFDRDPEIRIREIGARVGTTIQLDLELVDRLREPTADEERTEPPLEPVRRRPATVHPLAEELDEQGRSSPPLAAQRIDAVEHPIGAGQTLHQRAVEGRRERVGAEEGGEVKS